MTDYVFNSPPFRGFTLTSMSAESCFDEDEVNMTSLLFSISALVWIKSFVNEIV